MASKKRRAAAPPTSRRGVNLLIGAGALALAAIVVAAVFLALTNDDGGGGVRRNSVRQPTPVVITGMQTTVHVVNTDYDPAVIKIPVGAVVTWEFQDRIPHNVTEDRLLFESGNLRNGQTYAYTFDAPGEYFYYCTLHHKMLGTVIAGEGAATPTAAPSTPTGAAP